MPPLEAGAKQRASGFSGGGNHGHTTAWWGWGAGAWGRYTDLYTYLYIASTPLGARGRMPDETVCRGQPAERGRKCLQGQEYTLSASHKIMDLGANGPAGISAPNTLSSDLHLVF